MDLVSLGRLSANRFLQRARARRSARTGRYLHRPVQVFFEIAPVCDYKCLHCPVWSEKRDAADLSQDEWLGALRGLRRSIGPFGLGFTSGEPLLSPALLPLLREARALGVQTSVVTHGGRLDDAAAAALADAGLGTLVVSLDGMDPRTHDLSRGVPGAHAAAVAGLRRVLALPRRPVLKLNTLIAGHNLAELADVARWAAGLGLDGVSYVPLRRRGPDWKRLWPEPGAARAALDALIAARRSGLPVLNAERELEAFKAYFENPDAEFPDFDCETALQLHAGRRGELRFCVALPPVGDLRRQSWDEVWASAAARERAAEIRDCKRSCILLNCNARAGLGARAAEFARQALGR